MIRAPIAILAYSRIDHLRNTITSLQKNTLALESDLYLFLDGPKKGDEDKVNAVRGFLYTITGFKNVHIVERKTNNLVRNFEDGMELLFNQYGRCIYMDDDIITAPGFLQFMNDALDYSKNQKHIFSITGFCPPIKADAYCQEDYFLLPRFCAWGFGIWKDKYELIKRVSQDQYKSFMKNKRAVLEFIFGGGEDMLAMLESEAYGRIYTTDVKAMYWQFLHKQHTLYPRKSLVFNAGHDGTGLHCGETDRFNVKLWDRTRFSFNENVLPNDKIIKANRKFRSLGLKYKFKLLTQLLGVYGYIKWLQVMIRR